ncbi:MAG TPA: hypothetical protein PLA01_05825, partial [Acetivibrio sp.]|nr:hypothetical protein [Acetivibrio sp.]
MSTTYSVVFALIILNVVIVLLLILKANPLDLFRYFYAWLTGRLAKINTKKTTERIKRKRIEKEKKGIISRYNNMVENLIEDYHLPLTLEGFNTVLTFLIIVAVIFIFIFVKNVLLSILVSISLTVA